MQNGTNLSQIPDHVAMKILYTPHNIHTERIIDRAARVFQTFAYVQDWAEQIANCSDEFLINFPPNSSQANFSRLLVAVLLGDNVTVDDFTINNVTVDSQTLKAQLDRLRANSSVDNLEFLRGLLNESAPGNIWEVVTNVRDIAVVIHDFLDRFNWDVFYPVPDQSTYIVTCANQSVHDRMSACRNMLPSVACTLSRIKYCL